MAQVVASTFATAPEQVLRAARRAAMAGADWLELRLDSWPPGRDLGPVLAQVPLPVLVACRTPEDGGQWRGTLAERRELLTHALAAGAQGLDLELWETWSPPAGRTGLKLRVRSFHSFTGVPKELASIHARLLQHPGAVAKLVVTAHDLADAAPVLDLLQHLDQQRQPTVAFAMGRSAWPTRLLGALLGAPFVYASIDGDEPTAPGQLPTSLLAGLFRARELSSATMLYGLLGNPALQSLGPFLHNRLFRRLGVDALYLPFETSRPEAVLAMLPKGRLRGLSVTAPHKAAMAAQCHRLADEAAATGVVNTMVREANGLWVGHNTDVAGVREPLRPALGAAASGAVAAVLGTGGAARAAAVALAGLGARVTMLGRSLEPVREFARSQGVQLASFSAAVLDELRPAVVVQATPLGSKGRDPEERPLPEWRPAAGTVVFELVYQPRWTRFLRDAAAAGAVVLPGAAMFVAQACDQARWFTGQPVPSALVRQCLAGTAVTDA